MAFFCWLRLGEGLNTGVLPETKGGRKVREGREVNEDEDE
jgi:hypothetical protein